MRIAFVAQPLDVMYPPVVRAGSLALWIYYMARECAKREHESIVFGNNGGLFSAKSVEDDNVKYVFTPTGPNRLLNKVSRIGSKLFNRTQSANDSAFATVSAKNLTTSEASDVAKPQVTVFAPSGKASSDWPVDRSAVAERYALPRHGTRGYPLFASSWHHRLYAAEVAYKVRQLKCDVVHIINYSQFVPVIRAIVPQCKISLHMQCEWLSQLDSTLITSRLQKTDLIVGCSEYITGKIAAKFPQYADRCVTVPNAAAEVPEDGRAAGSMNVLFVNRLSPEKGAHDTIRAFHRVLEQFPEARLSIVGGAGSTPFEYVMELTDDPNVLALRVFYEKEGNGTREPYLEILENEAGEELGERIVFEGHVPHDKIGAYYDRAAVLVSSSIWNEPGNICLVEAMMHGVPVVGTRVGGTIYTVDHGRTGLLVNPSNPDALAGTICEILGNRERARQMGRAGRRKAIEQFSWQRTADLLLQHFSAPARI
jgi:spore coat protein SA